VIDWSLTAIGRPTTGGSGYRSDRDVTLASFPSPTFVAMVIL
jgi:hypothetical protein